MTANFKNDDHALRTGMFFAFLHAKLGYVDAVYDSDGDYTPRMTVRGTPFGMVTIEVLPPEDGQ